MNEIININHFTFSYDTKIILNDINIQVFEGEIVGLLGENGAGKTTLLNCIYGFLGEQKEIKILSSTPCLDNEIIKNNVGFIEDTPVLLDYLTADQYLRFICKIENISIDKVQNKIDELILKFKLKEEYTNKLLKDYSFGMKKKIHFIGNLIKDNSILLIDEPTNGLDITAIIYLKQIIKNLSQKNKTTILISSHNLDFINAVCNRVLIFNNGRINKDLSLNENINLEQEFLDTKLKGE